jgi:ABC-2 type transport system permease protein
MSIQEQWIAFLTIVRKEVYRFMRIWMQTLLPPAITMSLYFVVFGSLIGSRIGPMEGFSYMEFVVPGLIMMSVITNSYSNVASSFYSAKFQNSVEEMLVSPMPNYIILLGYLVGGSLRGLAVGLIVTLMSMFFTDLNIHSLPVMIGIVLLAAILFSLMGFLNAVYANSFDDISIIPTFILAPLTYLGGVFYSINLLSGIWRDLSLLNPILYLVNAFRYGILGLSDIDVASAFIGVIIFVVLLFLYALRVLNVGQKLRN